ncbi:MAG: hypothetical protein IID16_01065 [Candidatus Marinimicrobia bacterium]|nr:hypothetical protein [Candidatus Neomarinimicrobiota bacterium]
MRIDCKKDISFSEFKKMLPKMFLGYNVDVKEKAYIREFEKATGQSYGKVERSSKEVKRSGKELGKDKE